MGDGSY
ncbi:Protein of unknown function [Bacillus cereus]|nr:Protein of unknown function [Bacillus cereus]